ncbi:MAG: exonuclease subunit SbcD [Proteiniphilum sp.]|jgi:exonuclease SbcD|nr:exonuclease subunit SbcD [Proteiniphilum sp.]HHT34924.1 exonuclease subunit SbcD [Bacteroidales bacterium]MDD2726738.1 exonuclease subunit SbcD [Proteiniphilum sp.]MDD3332694.1 exonuclease subunit SbcD [Proteiniphilum sp.]MDD4486035.1 exonuclease subunit SbcD [Proteiniphilum sp.]
MRILHTADWHLGKRLDDFPRLEEQREVMEEICEIAEQEAADVVLVAGDLFDTFNPPTEAVDLLYRTLKRLSAEGRRPVIAIAGNHDSPDRIEAADPLARECGILFAGYPHTEIPPYLLESGLRVLKSEKGFLELLLPGSSFPLRILFTPYANEYRLKTFLGLEESEKELRSILQERWQHLADSYCDQQGVNILLSHLFVVRRGDTLPEEPEEEKPILQVGGAQAIFTENIPSQIQYTALGHLHRMHFVEKGPSPVCYSGSPLSYSFAEAGQQKQLLMIDLEPGVAAVVRELPLTRSKMLLRKRAEGIDEALQWLSENRDALVELTIVTDSFLTAMERRALMAAHPGIVSIIPEVTDAEKLTESGQKQIDLTKGMEALFRDYFRHEKGQEPNDEIMQLFHEIVAEEE